MRIRMVCSLLMSSICRRAVALGRRTGFLGQPPGRNLERLVSNISLYGFYQAADKADSTRHHRGCPRQYRKWNRHAHDRRVHHLRKRPDCNPPNDKLLLEGESQQRMWIQARGEEHLEQLRQISERQWRRRLRHRVDFKLRQALVLPSRLHPNQHLTRHTKRLGLRQADREPAGLLQNRRALRQHEHHHQHGLLRRLGWEVYADYPNCPQNQAISGSRDRCVDFVGNNPQPFTEAYWDFNSIRVYQMPVGIEPTSSYSTSLSTSQVAASTNTIDAGMGRTSSSLSSVPYTGPLSSLTSTPATSSTSGDEETSTRTPELPDESGFFTYVSSTSSPVLSLTRTKTPSNLRARIPTDLRARIPTDPQARIPLARQAQAAAP
jgi:hypothetical protein